MTDTLVLAQIAATPLIAGILSLAAGIIVLLVPRALNYVVAVYLIIVGILQIIAAL